MENFEANENKSEIQIKIEEKVGKVNSLEELAMILVGVALMTPTLFDPETGNNLNTERIANAVRSGDGIVLADEVPKWLIRAIKKAELIE